MQIKSILHRNVNVALVLTSTYPVITMTTIATMSMIFMTTSLVVTSSM